MREFRIFNNVMSHWHFDKDQEAQSTPYDMWGEPPDGRELTRTCDKAEENGNEVDDLDVGAPEQAAAELKEDEFSLDCEIKDGHCMLQVSL
jgi:hypothetical protein